MENNHLDPEDKKVIISLLEAMFKAIAKGGNTIKAEVNSAGKIYKITVTREWLEGVRHQTCQRRQEESGVPLPFRVFIKGKRNSEKFQGEVLLREIQVAKDEIEQYPKPMSRLI